jgi:O-glycosyl hydrolase
VKIIAPDTASWPNVDKYLTPLLADPASRDYLSVVATHPYQNGNAPIKLDYDKPAENGKRFWQSEWSQENPKGDTPNPTMTSAIVQPAAVRGCRPASGTCCSSSSG